MIQIYENEEEFFKLIYNKKIILYGYGLVGTTIIFSDLGSQVEYIVENEVKTNKAIKAIPLLSLAELVSKIITNQEAREYNIILGSLSENSTAIMVERLRKYLGNSKSSINIFSLSDYNVELDIINTRLSYYISARGLYKTES